MPNLKLFYRPTCPYCRKVLTFMDEKKIEMEMKNISDDPQALEQLIAVGGKQQVPCLFIDDKPMYESGDIVNWLAENI